MLNESNAGEFVPQKEQVLNFHRILVGNGPFRAIDSQEHSTTASDQSAPIDRSDEGTDGEEQQSVAEDQASIGSGINESRSGDRQFEPPQDNDNNSAIIDWWSDSLLDNFPFLPSNTARSIMHSRLPDISAKEIRKAGGDYTLCKKGHSLSIAKLIDQLRDEKFKTRESAANKLYQLPEAIFQMGEKLNELKGKQFKEDLEQQSALRHILACHNAKALLRLERDVLSDNPKDRERAYEKLEKKPGQLTSMVPKLREQQEQLELTKAASEQISFLNKLVPAFARVADKTFDQRINIERAINEIVTRCGGVELDKFGKIRSVVGAGFAMEIKYDGNRIASLRSEWIDGNSKFDKRLPDAPPLQLIRRSLNLDAFGKTCRVRSSEANERIDSEHILDGRVVPSIQLDRDGNLEIHSTDGMKTFETGLARGNRTALKYISR